MTVDLNTKTCPPDDPDHSGEHICGRPDHYHVNGYPSGCPRCDPSTRLSPDEAVTLTHFINNGGTFTEIS